MESCVKPESRNIVGTCRRKRKLEDEEQGESSSMAGSSSMVCLIFIASSETRNAI